MSFQVRGPGGLVVALAMTAFVVLFALPVSTQGPGRGSQLTRINGADAVEGEVLVKYRDDRVEASHTAIEAAADADVVESLDRRGTRRMRSRRLRTEELLSLLAQDPDVEYVEPNFVVRLLNAPADLYWNSLWGLWNTGHNTVGGGGTPGADIDAPSAWVVTTGPWIGAQLNTISVLDTGIDYNHPDLAANIWSAPSPFQVTIGGVAVTCAAGTHGFNAVTRTCDPMDDHFHGTHAAGTIGARGDNLIGVTGINWTASMMAVKILGASGSGTVADAVAGMEFVLQAKAAFASTGAANVRILSNSWASSGYSATLMNAIDAANSADMLFVAAAGNSGTNNDVAPVYPASYPTANMVAVAASTNTDQRASFSNYGASSVHLAAPGTAILSTVPGNAYAVAQGTSMATPHVSGVALLALSICTMSTSQLKDLLLNSVDAVPAFSGITTTGGRLNARWPVENCPRARATSLTLTPSVEGPRPLGTTVTWTAVAGGGYGPYHYRFYVWDGAAWSIAQDFSSLNTFAWTPSVASDSYKVAVHVRHARSTTGSELQNTKSFAIKTPASSVTLTSSLVAPQGLGTSVTWTASAAGGQAPYSYRFIVWDGLAWTDARQWDASNVFTWTPTVANPNYKVAVLVRSAWNTGANEISITKPFAIRPIVTSATLSSDLTAPRLTGTTVTFTATATGGEAPYAYQFFVWNGLTWTLARPWDASRSFSWTPGVANADYRVLVQVRSAWNTGEREIATSRPFAILAPVTSVALTPNKTSPRPLGDTVTFTATASGGQAPYQYQWRVWNLGWTVAQSWSTSNVFVWTPTTAYDQYQVQVQVRGAWNTGASEREATLSYAMRQGVTALTLTPSLSSPRPRGTTIRWTASATGGQAPHQYQWVVYDGVTWANVTSWTTSNTFDWTPTVPFAYRIAVRVRSSWNTGLAEATVIQDYAIQ